MKLLLFSLVAFCIGVALHIAWWRIRLPVGQTYALLKVFVLVYIAAILVSFHASAAGYVPIDIWERLHFTLFYVSSALTYTSLYSLIEHRSPSLEIIERIAEAGDQGCSLLELSSLGAQEDIIEHRLRAAAGNGLVKLMDRQWALTPKGRIFATLFNAAATIYRFERAG